MKTITADVALDVINCCSCGMPFAFPEDLVRRRRRDHQTFYCPTGHGNCFTGESEEEKLRKRLARAEETTQFYARRAEREQARAERIERSRRAVKGQLTKVKNRVQHGVCPCCSRTFQDLARHMATKHPDFAAADAAEG